MPDNNLFAGALSGVSGLDPSSVNGTTPTKKTKNDQVNKDQFLQLLVTQLKNQDPMDPMKNEEFATQLAQFSQLEKLISIDEKIGKQGNGDLSTMASYLGKEVTLNTDKLQFKNGDGGIVKVDLLQDSNNVKIQLLDSNGQVKSEIDVGSLHAGTQRIKLTAAASENGTYGFKVVGIDTNGVPFSKDGKVAGIVSGYVPGPTPSLLVSGRTIDPNDVVEIGLPASGG